MTDIGSWLERHGLEKYADLFVEHEIDLDVLDEITLDELKDLGIPLGARKRILKAVARSNGDDGETPSLPMSPSGQAERRQLTVMFADLIGSTQLSARLDPEDEREINRAYQNVATACIEKYGGYVARYMGDGVLSYFGYPQAHEDDAERAVQAGLAICEAVPALDVGTVLAVRVGIATGRVVVGDLIGKGASQESAVVGETANLASRLQGEAPVNRVVISETTQRLIGGTFELTPVPERALKGFEDAIPLWVVKAERRYDSRFEALRNHAPTAYVGRTGELGLLLDRWRVAETGEGQVVLLSGEPGMGKSRLTQELRTRLGAAHPTELRYQCTSSHNQSAYHPFVSRLYGVAGFEPVDTADMRLDKLETLMPMDQADRSVTLSLLAALMSLPTDRYPPLVLSPGEQKVAMARIFELELERLCADQAVLIRFEDIHWADPSTCELLAQLIQLVAKWPVLLLLTFRPEFEPPWSQFSNTTTLTLNRLALDDARSVITNLTEDVPLSDETIAEIIARADGVPLYLEELSRAVLEDLGDSGDIERGQRRSARVPATLHDSLLARLDRLGRSKGVAQLGALLGREFSYALLADFIGERDEILNAHLSILTSAGILTRRDGATGPTFTFRHALIQDAAYESLLLARRRELHQRLAAILIEGSYDVEPEIVAQHLTVAHESEAASEYWTRAGRNAQQRFAPHEAVAHFEAALEAILTLPVSAERDRRELELQVSLGGQYIMSRHYGSPEVGTALVRARDLGRELGEKKQLAETLVGLYRYYLGRGEFEEVRRNGEELFSLGRETRSDGAVLAGVCSLGHCSFFIGKLSDSQRHFEDALTRYAQLERPPSLAEKEQYAGATLNLSLGRMVLGFPDDALEYYARGLALAEQAGEPFRIAYALMFGCELHWLRREVSSVRECAERALAISTQGGYAWWRAQSLVFAGWAQARTELTSEGIDRIVHGLEEHRRLGVKLYVPDRISILADAQRSLGDLAASLETVEQALATEETTGERWTHAELQRMRAELLIEMDRPDDAERLLQEALSSAKAQDARMWTLKASATLATLWRTNGQPQAAAEILEPIYSWFTEGYETTDLIHAKALLSDLRGA